MVSVRRNRIRCLAISNAYIIRVRGMAFDLPVGANADPAGKSIPPGRRGMDVGTQGGNNPMKPAASRKELVYHAAARGIASEEVESHLGVRRSGHGGAS